MHPDSLDLEEKAERQTDKDEFALALKEHIAQFIVCPSEDVTTRMDQAYQLLGMVDILARWEV